MSANKTIAKNTLFLYLRMLLTLGISLYTSRIVLEALGFVDYGIYALVGGMVALISFMHSSLSGATTRFMNVEMGKGDEHNLKTIFSSAILIHLSLCVIVLLLGETLGLWFLYNKLNIPENRFFAASVVYQLSLFSVLMTILQTPYDAAIIAHQKMSVYAYISIGEAVLKLAVAFGTIYLPYDNLIVYASLTFIASILVRLAYQIYCRKNFQECRFSRNYDKEYIKSITAFFGWDLYGNMSVAVKNQGLQILQNIFFGATINAAAGIANTVTGVVGGFSSNFTLAVKPQIFQSYASGDIKEMNRLLIFSARFTYFLMFLFSISFIVETDFFLNLWLVKVPPYASVFCKLIFIQICITSLFKPLNNPIHATGKIKALSFIGGTVIMSALLLSWIVLKVTPKPTVVYVVNIVVALVGGIINMFILKTLISSFDIKHYFFKVLIFNVLITVLASVPGLLAHYYFPHSLINSVLVILILIICNLVTLYFLGLNNNEKEFIKNKMTGFINLR